MRCDRCGKNLAEYACSKCGKIVCEDCYERVDEKILCLDCSRPKEEKEKDQSAIKSVKSGIFTMAILMTGAMIILFIMETYLGGTEIPGMTQGFISSIRSLGNTITMFMGIILGLLVIAYIYLKSK